MASKVDSWPNSAQVSLAKTRSYVVDRRVSRGARNRWPFLDVTGDVTGGMRKRWPANRDQAPIALPISSPVTEGLGPGPVYLTPKD